MKKVFCYIILQYFVTIRASKPQSVNLALETVLEFDHKQNSGDVNLIDQVQHFLDKVKKVIGNNHYNRRSLNPGRLKFTDFLTNALEILLKYDNDALEDVLTVVDDEIRKYHYKGCKFYEVLENDQVRQFMADNLDAIKVKSIKKVKKAMNASIVMLRDGHLDDKTKNLFEYIDTLYPHDSQTKFLDVLKNLKAYSHKNRRSNMNLIKIVRSGIRNVIFDHYSDLNLNARKDLNVKLDGFWGEYKDPFKISYNVWTNDGTIVTTTPKTLVNQFMKIVNNLKPETLLERFVNHPYIGYNGEDVPKKNNVPSRFIASDNPNSIEIEDNLLPATVIQLTTKKVKKLEPIVYDEDISKVNDDYHYTKKEVEKRKEKIKKIVHTKPHKTHKRHKTTHTTKQIARKKHKSKKEKRKRKEYKHKGRQTVISNFDDEESKRRQTIAATPSLQPATLWTEKIKKNFRSHTVTHSQSEYEDESNYETGDRRQLQFGKIQHRPYVVTERHAHYKDKLVDRRRQMKHEINKYRTQAKTPYAHLKKKTNFELNEKRRKKFETAKHRFEYQRDLALSTDDMRRRNPGNLMKRHSSDEGMSIESSGFSKISLRRKSNTNTTELPNDNKTESLALEKLKILENELKYVKEKIRISETATIFDKLSFWASTVAGATEISTVNDRATKVTPIIENTPTTINNTKATDVTTTAQTTQAQTQAMSIHFRNEVTNATYMPETTKTNKNISDLKMVVAFAAKNQSQNADIRPNTLEVKKEDPMNNVLLSDGGKDVETNMLIRNVTAERAETRSELINNDVINKTESVNNVTITTKQVSSEITTDIFDVDDTLDIL